LLDPRAQRAPQLRDSECTGRVSVELASDIMATEKSYLGKVSEALGAIGRRLSCSLTLGGSGQESTSPGSFGVPEDEYVLGVHAIKGPIRQSSTRSRSDLDLYIHSPEVVTDEENPAEGEANEDKDILSEYLDPVVQGTNGHQRMKKSHTFSSDSKSSCSDSSGRYSRPKKTRGRGVVYSSEVEPRDKDAVSAANDSRGVPALLEPGMEQSCEGNWTESTAMASPMRSTRSVPSERTGSPNRSRQRSATRPRPRTPSPLASPRTNLYDIANVHV